MKFFSHKNLFKLRKIFLQENAEKDFVCIPNDSKILISVPHAVSQVRLGKHKHEEIGSVPVGLTLAKELNSNLIVKTKNNNDDANFDEVSDYKKKIEYLISACRVKYIFDIHGLRKSCDCDINLGINFGNNINSDIDLFNNLEQELIRAGFKVSIDNPFKAAERTISGYFAKNFNVWTIQMEINCSITNESKNSSKFNCLLSTLIKVLKNL